MGDPYKTDEDWAIPSKGSAPRSGLQPSSLGLFGMALIAAVLLSLTFNGYLLLRQNDLAERAYISDASRQQEVADLLARLDGASDELEELRTRNVTLERQLSTKTSDADSQSSMLVQAEASISALRQQLEALSAERDGLEASLEDASALVASLRRGEELLKADLVESAEEVEKLRAENSDIAAERDELATSNAQASESAAATTKALQEEIEKSADLREKLAQADSEIEALLERVATLEERLLGMEQVLEDQKERLSKYPAASSGSGFVFFAFIPAIIPQDESLDETLSDLTIRSFDFTRSRVPAVIFSDEKYQNYVVPDVYGTAIFRAVPSSNTRPESIRTENFGIVEFFRIKSREELAGWKSENSNGIVEPDQRLYIQGIVILGDQLWLRVCLDQGCEASAEE